MKLEISSNSYYLRYLEIREKLPLYYCHTPTFHFPKGFYRCYEGDDGNVTIYYTARGIKVGRHYFDLHFKKPSKLRLFLYKHLKW